MRMNYTTIIHDLLFKFNNQFVQLSTILHLAIDIQWRILYTNLVTR